MFSSTSFASTEEKHTLKVAFFPNITHSQALVGKYEGTFQKELGSSVIIEWKEFNAGSSEIQAFMTGDADLGYIGPCPAINGYVRTKGELQIIAGAARAGAILVSRKDLIIKKISELKGKRVAVPQFGNTQDLSLRHLLRQNGLIETEKGGTVEIIQAENPDIKVILDSGNTDAALVPEPWGSRLVDEINANIVLDYKDIWKGGNYPTAVIIARRKFMNENPGIVTKFIKTHLELTDYIKTNKEKAKKIINLEIKKLTGKNLSKEILDSAFTRVVVTYDPDKLVIAEMANLSLESGFLKKYPDLKDLFNLKILNNILKKNGKKQID